MKQIAFFLPIFLFLVSVINAQHPLQKTYTIQNGLAMTETMHVGQDSKGYIWVISTNGRLSRYDGVNFKAYPPTGQGAVHLSTLAEQANGELLAYDGGGATSFNWNILRGDSILPLSDLPRGISSLFNQFDDNLYFKTLDSLYRVSSVTLAVDSVACIRPFIPEGSRTTGFVNDQGRFMFYDSSAEEYGITYLDGQRKRTSFPASKGARVIILKGGWSAHMKEAKSELEIYDDSLRLVRTIDYSPYVKSPNHVAGLFPTNGKFVLWEKIPPSQTVDAYVNRFYRIDPLSSDSAYLFIEYLSGSVTDSRFAITKNGDFWTVGHSGLRQIIPNTQAFYSGAKGMVNSLHAINEATNGDIIMGGYGTGFTRFAGKELRLERNSKLAEIRQVLPGSYRDSNGTLLFMSEFGDPGRGIVRLTEKGQLSTITITPPFGNPLTGYHFSKARLPVTSPILRKKTLPPGADSIDQLVVSMVGTREAEGTPSYGNIILLDLPVSENPDYRVINNKQGITVRNILCTAQDKAGRIWFGHGSTGIGIYDPARDTAQTWLVEKAGDPGAMAMVIDRHDRLWLAAVDGLYYIDGASTIALQPSPHLRSRRKKCLLREVPAFYVASLLLRGDTLIAGHGGGVSFIDISGDVTAPPAFTIPLPEFGLGAAEQNALLIDRKGWLWVGADEGAVALDYKHFLRERGMQGEFEIAVKSDLGIVPPSSDGKYRLPIGDRSVNLGYQLSIPDQQAGHIKADVFLLNDRGDTLKYARSTESSRFIRHDYLDHGSYTLLVQSFMDNTLIQEKRAALIVPPRLLECWWFWPGVVAVLLGFVILVLRLKVIRTREKLKEEQARLREEKLHSELLEAERDNERMQVSTLVSTINPHFVSNAITWMQSAMAVGRSQDDIDEVADNLSQTIRSIFTKSFIKKPSHSLREELALVQRYFNTVNIQYRNRYQFEMPTDEQIKRMGDYQVLLMQIQIHAENAFEHGLRNRPAGKKVSVRLNEDNDYIYLIIEDEGAGTKLVAERQAANNRPPGIGTQIMRRLQKVFNKRNSDPITTNTASQIFLSEEPTGRAYGTRVTVTIPKHYSYALESPRR